MFSGYTFPQTLFEERPFLTEVKHDSYKPRSYDFDPLDMICTNSPSGAPTERLRSSCSYKTTERPTLVVLEHVRLLLLYPPSKMTAERLLVRFCFCTLRDCPRVFLRVFHCMWWCLSAINSSTVQADSNNCFLGPVPSVGGRHLIGSFSTRKMHHFFVPRME